MANLETRLIISAVDESKRAFDAVQGHIRELQTTAKAVSGVAAGVGPAAVGTRAATQALGGVAGMAAAASAAAGLAVAYGSGIAVRHAVEAVSARQHEIVRMAVAGMRPDEIAEATLQATKLMAEMPSVGMSETMHMLRNARSIVGSYKEAAEIAEPLMKLRTLAQLAHPGQDVAEDFDLLLKAMEIKGVTQNPERFKRDMDLVAKSMNVFGDTLKPVDYFEMVQHARQAAAGLSDNFLFTVGPTLAQEMKGASFGTGLAGFNRFIVSGIGKKGSFDELARLGLIDKHARASMPGSGEGHGLKAGRTVAGWRVAQENPYEWVKNYLIPAFERAGIKDLAAQMREVAVLFPQVSGQLVQILSTQQTRIDKDIALGRGAAGLSAADRAMREDPALAWQALKGSIDGLISELGDSLGAGKGFAGWMTTWAQAIAANTAAIEEETKAQREGRPSPGLKDIRERLNKRLFGVASDDFDYAHRVSRRRDEDASFRDISHGWVTDADRLEADIASRRKWISGKDQGAAIVQAQLAQIRMDEANLARLAKEASEGTAAWRNKAALRGEDDYAIAMGDALAARKAGRDGPFAAGAAGVPLTAYVAAAQREAEVRVWGEAQVEQTISMDVTIDPILRATLVGLGTMNFGVPLMGAAPTGRMDGDAAPARSPWQRH